MYIAFVVEGVEDLLDLRSRVAFAELSSGQFEELCEIEAVGVFAVE
jgi:hypothetical protein